MMKSSFREYDSSRRLFHNKVNELASETLQQARLAMGTSKEDAYLQYLTGIFMEIAKTVGDVTVEPFVVWKGKNK